MCRFKMDKEELYKIINNLFSVWNPIGLPKDIADVEYLDYVRIIVDKLQSNNKITDYLFDILNDISSNEVIIHSSDIIEETNKLGEQIEELYETYMNDKVSHGVS